jgi:hypothetical protein
METVEKIDIESKYSDKLRELFELGREPLMNQTDLEIYTKFNFVEDDIDELIDLALDESYNFIDYDKFEKESDRVFYATIHAVNVLGILKAKRASVPLLERMEREEGLEDFFNDVIINFFNNLGEEGLDDIENYIFNNPQSQEIITIIDALGHILKNNTHLFGRIEEILVKYLKNSKTESSGLAFAIHLLIEYSQDKHIDLIRETFESKDVDIFFAGDLEDIEIKLGLREKRESEKPSMFSFLKDYENELESESINTPSPLIKTNPKIGRNDPCPCGSGKKYKKCCLNK